MFNNSSREVEANFLTTGRTQKRGHFHTEKCCRQCVKCAWQPTRQSTNSARKHRATPQPHIQPTSQPNQPSHQSTPSNQPARPAPRAHTRTYTRARNNINIDETRNQNNKGARITITTATPTRNNSAKTLPDCNVGLESSSERIERTILDHFSPRT